MNGEVKVQASHGPGLELPRVLGVADVVAPR